MWRNSRHTTRFQTEKSIHLDRSRQQVWLLTYRKPAVNAFSQLHILYWMLLLRPELFSYFLPWAEILPTSRRLYHEHVRYEHELQTAVHKKPCNYYTIQLNSRLIILNVHKNFSKSFTGVNETDKVISTTAIHKNYDFHRGDCFSFESTVNRPVIIVIIPNSATSV